MNRLKFVSFYGIWQTTSLSRRR